MKLTCTVAQDGLPIVPQYSLTSTQYTYSCLYTFGGLINIIASVRCLEKLGNLITRKWPPCSLAYVGDCF